MGRMRQISRFPQRIWWSTAVLLLILAACTSAPPEQAGTDVPPDKAAAAAKYADYTIVTLLPRDAIPAIDNPRFLSAAVYVQPPRPPRSTLRVECPFRRSASIFLSFAETVLTFGNVSAFLTNHKNNSEVSPHSGAAAASQIQPARNPPKPFSAIIRISPDLLHSTPNALA